MTTSRICPAFVSHIGTMCTGFVHRVQAGGPCNAKHHANAVIAGAWVEAAAQNVQQLWLAERRIAPPPALGQCVHTLSWSLYWWRSSAGIEPASAG